MTAHVSLYDCTHVSAYMPARVPLKQMQTSLFMWLQLALVFLLGIIFESHHRDIWLGASAAGRHGNTLPTVYGQKTRIQETLEPAYQCIQLMTDK